MQTRRTSRRVLTLGMGCACISGVLSRQLVRAESPPAMTVEQTQSTMGAYFDALFGVGPYESFFAEDVVLTLVGTDEEIKGPAAAENAIDALLHEQFDAAPEVTNLVVGPGRAALEAEFIGTHTGEFAGIPSTGKQVDVPYSAFYELQNGKITSLRIYGLVDGLVHQLSTVEKTGRKGVGPLPPG